MSDNSQIREWAKSPREDSESSRITREKLQQPIPVDFRANELANVIHYLRLITGTNFVVQWRSLEAAGISRETPITMQLDNVTAERALRLILDDAGGDLVKLSYTIEEGVVIIATHEFLAAKTEIRTYDIRDLIAPIPAESAEITREDRVTAVMDLIRNSVARDCWVPVGLTSSMEELGGTLIVNTTNDNHLSIAKLLRQIRVQQTLQIAFKKPNYGTDPQYDDIAEHHGLVEDKVNSVNTSRIFIVHGHDESERKKVARFVEKLGLEAIILHEQSNRGQTIIEKLERYASVDFAVILLTPDDWGGKNQTKNLKPRARQNVILELGFFYGKLGRSRVCALHKGDVELPSDFNGVLYVPLDEGGAWQAKLTKEIKDAGISVDISNLVQKSE
ncbi:MAG: nucleotide-binding protein [Phycisphaeraceae bacterium]